MFLPPPYPSRHLVTTKLPTNWPRPLILATLSSPVAPLQRAVGCVKNNRAATRSRSRFGGPPGRGGGQELGSPFEPLLPPELGHSLTSLFFFMPHLSLRRSPTSWLVTFHAGGRESNKRQDGTGTTRRIERQDKGRTGSGCKATQCPGQDAKVSSGLHQHARY